MTSPDQNNPDNDNLGNQNSNNQNSGHNNSPANSSPDTPKPDLEKSPSTANLPDSSNPLENAQQPEQPPQTPLPKKRYYLRWILLFLVLVLAALVGTIGWMTTTTEGSKRLLAILTSRLSWVTYQYAGGNFQDGLRLSNVKVATKAVDIYVKEGMLKIGWRALVNKELHFRYASLNDLKVVKKTPPSDKPFDFKQLKLPVTLRFDEAFVHGLSIQTKPESVIRFSEIVLHEAVWSGTELALKDSSVTLPALRAQEVTGKIVFEGKYPLHVDGVVLIPALKNLNIQHINVAARGNLDTLIAGLSLAQPHGVRGQVVLHPVEKNVPFKGYLNWKNLNWPVAQNQELFSKSGDVSVEGSTLGLIANIQTDLVGKSIPQGNYVAQLATNYQGLTLNALNGRLMGGTLQTQGTVSWKPRLSWNITGRASGLDSQDKTVPESIRPYLPPKINANLYSKGEMADIAKLYAAIKLDSANNQPETWLAGVARKGGLGNQAEPLWIDARWRNLSRSLKGVGEVNSPSGSVLLSMPKDQLNATVNASFAETKTGRIPVGQYTARVIKKANKVDIPSLVYQGAAGQIQGNAKLQLPQGKQGLQWQAQLVPLNLDPSKLVASIPFTRVNGVINATGRGTDTSQIIQLTNTRLNAFMPANTAQGTKTGNAAGRTIELTGNTTAALFFYEKPKTNPNLQNNNSQTVVAKNTRPSGLKSFAIQFNGDLKTPDVPNGDLVLKVSGTPKLINITELRHNGAAGNVNASGQIDLSTGPAWRLSGNLAQFNPGFFVKGYEGLVSGSFNTTGHWQTNRKDVQLNQLNLSGTLKNQPLIAQGSLNVNFNTGKTKTMDLMPSQFQAQNLILAYAGNQLTANGNSRQLFLDVNAPALNRIYSGLAGTVLGRITLTGNQRQPDALVNVRINRFAFKQQLSIESARLVGRIPQMGQLPGQLQLDIQNLKRGNQTLSQGRVILAGTKATHVLQINGTSLTPATQFGLQLAGGFNANNDWLGQVQKGSINTRQINLVQDKPASLIYRKQANALYLDQHCWAGGGNSRLCLTEPLQASRANGLLSVQLQNLDIGSFQAFMPAGVAWSGKLFGYAKVTWLGNGAPSLNAQLYTDNGSIGLAPEDPQDEPLTLPYQRLSLIATTQSDGIKLRFDAKTPGIGRGYIDATINPKVTPKTVNGALVLEDVQLSILKPFFPGMRVLNGMASLAGGVSGPLTAPDFYGEFRLRDGQVAMNNLPINLNRINLSSSIRGTEATLAGDFYSGDAQARLTGDANWQGVPFVNLKLVGDNLLIRQPPLLTARVSPRIDVRILPTQQQVNVNGTIDVPSAVASMPENNASVIAKSGDVRVVRADQATQRVMKASKPWEIYANIGLSLGDEVFFRGFGTSIPLGGQLNITQRGLDTALRANGAIGVKQNVTIEAFGQRLQLNRGIARFNGIISQPTLDIDATKSISNRTVGVRVTGRANNPNIAIYNDAGLSEQEALNAMLTGRISSANPTVNNTAGFKSEVNNTIAAAGISMGLGGTRKLTNQIGRTFGLDSLTLDAEGVGDDTQVSLTGYITPDLYLRYGVGVFTPVNRLTLRYQLNRRLYVEASSALDRAVDMFYNWRF